MTTDKPPTPEELLAELPRLRRFTRLLSTSSAQADDLFQDSLEHALRSYREVDRSIGLRAWLFAIASKRHRDLRKGALRRPDDEPLETVDRTLSGSAESGEDAFLGDLERAFATLPKEYRAVLWLVCVEGLRYEEAAATLAIPLGTVRSRLHRGRRLLGEILLGPGGAGDGDGGDRR